MKEALKLALEALINAIAVRNGEGGTKLVSPLEKNAITAIKEALAQDEQGRLAKVEPCAVCGEGKARLLVLRSCDTCHSEYAGQAEMKVALGKPEQEPVAGDVHTEHCFQGEYKHCCKYGDGDDCTAAPKRPWVGLTDEGIQTIHDTYYRRMGPQEFARAIETKLKEKNA